MVKHEPLHVALYLTYLVRKSSTSAPVEEASNAISWAHQLAVVDDPTRYDLVKQVLAGARRILAHKTTKKEPITPEILERPVDEFTLTVAPPPELCDPWVHAPYTRHAHAA